MSTPAVSERRQWLCLCVAYNTALVSSTAANAKQPPSASKPCALFHRLLYSINHPPTIVATHSSSHTTLAYHHASLYM